MIISRDKYTHIEKNRETQGEKLIIYRERVRELIEQVLRLENSLPVANVKYPRRDAH